VLKTAQSVTHDEWLQRKVLVEGMKMLSESDLERPSAQIVFDVVRACLKTSGRRTRSRD